MKRQCTLAQLTKAVAAMDARLAKLEAAVPAKRETHSSVPLRDMELPVRALNVLDVLGVQTSGDFAKVSRRDLAVTKNCGAKTVREIEEYAEFLGLKLKPSAGIVRNRFTG